MIGKVFSINMQTRKVAVKHDDDSFSVFELLESVNISTGDIVQAQFMTGDVFVKNETKNIFFEGYIHHLHISEREMNKRIVI